MDNEELKKKIIEILEEGYTPVEYDDGDWGQTYFPTNEDVAGALIAAGLVADVRSLADGNCVLYVKGKGFMRLYNEQDINKMIHRAEVNEKMFNNLYEEISENMRVLSKEWYKYQAEKELAEEKNND